MSDAAAGPGEKRAGFVFGPVPSRRLGRSLGVDLVPFKTCTFDCIYCQVGRTTCLTTRRDSYVPVDEVVRELEEKLAHSARPDYITLSGAGEPTLNSDLGRVIARIRRITDIPIAILTNGSLLSDKEVRRACSLADVVLPTLTAGDEAIFKRIHRPAEGITFDGFVKGLVVFRTEFTGQIWLEVFLLAGINDTEEAVGKIKQIADRIRPDRLQLNTAVRPTSETDARAVPEEEMHRLAKLLGPKAEVIADFSLAAAMPAVAAKKDEVLAMLRRRPCTAEDVAQGLSIHLNEALKYIGQLQREEAITPSAKGDATYYSATRD
ncbi:MAG: radical SAM protein [Phycisphaerae bacterium]|nr:radical SAM protein [Phycisphaerae bacterium]